MAAPGEDDGTMIIHDGESIDFVISIMSGSNLLSADKTGLSDPYVKAIFAGKEIHKTKIIKKT